MSRSAILLLVAAALLVQADPVRADRGPEESAAALTTQRPSSIPEPRTPKGVCIAPTVLCAADLVAGGKAGDMIGEAAGDAVAGAADSVMSGVVGWAADGAAWLVREVAQQVERSSRPALDSSWFTRQYAGMAQLSIALIALFLLLAVGQAIARQDVTRLVRAVFVALPSALFLTFAAITLVQLGLAVTDALTAAALRGTGGDVRRAFHGLGELLTSPGAPSLAPFVLFLSAVLTAVLALIVWLELVMREAAVYVAVAFLPLTLAGLVWERSSHWSRRLAEWLFAIVFAKFTIGASFAIAAGAIADGPRGEGGLTTLLAGCAVLGIAALTPVTLLRLLPFAESAAGRSLSRGHISAAAGSVPGATSATIAARQLVLRNFGAKPGRSAGGPTSTPTPPRAASGRPTMATPMLPRANPPEKGRASTREPGAHG